MDALEQAPGTANAPLGVLSRKSVSRLSARLRRDGRPPPPRPFPALFEAQVARTPDAVALVYGQEQLSYGELNRRANRLAHRLIREGIGPESLVGLSVERSPAMVVACSPSSRRALPICRSTRLIPRPAWPSCWRMRSRL